MLRRWVTKNLSQLLAYTLTIIQSYLTQMIAAFFQAVLDRRADLVSVDACRFCTWCNEY